MKLVNIRFWNSTKTLNVVIWTPLTCKPCMSTTFWWRLIPIHGETRFGSCLKFQEVSELARSINSIFIILSGIWRDSMVWGWASVPRMNPESRSVLHLPMVRGPRASIRTKRALVILNRSMTPLQRLWIMNGNTTSVRTSNSSLKATWSGYCARTPRPVTSFLSVTFLNYHFPIHLGPKTMENRWYSLMPCLMGILIYWKT